MNFFFRNVFICSNGHIMIWICLPYTFAVTAIAPTPINCIVIGDYQTAIDNDPISFQEELLVYSILQNLFNDPTVDFHASLNYFGSSSVPNGKYDVSFTTMADLMGLRTSIVATRSAESPLNDLANFINWLNNLPSFPPENRCLLFLSAVTEIAGIHLRKTDIYDAIIAVGLNENTIFPLTPTYAPFSIPWDWGQSDVQFIADLVKRRFMGGCDNVPDGSKLNNSLPEQPVQGFAYNPLMNFTYFTNQSSCCVSMQCTGYGDLYIVDATVPKYVVYASKDDQPLDQFNSVNLTLYWNTVTQKWQGEEGYPIWSNMLACQVSSLNPIVPPPTSPTVFNKTTTTMTVVPTRYFSSTLHSTHSLPVLLTTLWHEQSTFRPTTSTKPLTSTTTRAKSTRIQTTPSTQPRRTRISLTTLWHENTTRRPQTTRRHPWTTMPPTTRAHAPTVPPFPTTTERPHHGNTEFDVRCKCNTTTVWNDVMFVMDRSSVTGADGIYDMYDTMLTLVSAFNVQATGTVDPYHLEVGVVLYNSEAVLAAPLGSTSDELYDLNPLTFYQRNDTRSDLEKGLHLAMQQFNRKTRTSSRNVIVVMTTTYDPLVVDDPQTIADQFRADGGIIITYDYVQGHGEPALFLGQIASPGYSMNSINNGMDDLVVAQCSANCFCPGDSEPFTLDERNSPTEGCYKTVETPANEHLAERSCVSRQQGFLVEIKSAKKNAFTAKLMTPAAHSIIGLKWNSTLEEWRWLDGTGLTIYSNFNGNSSHTSGLDCVYMEKNTNLWNTVDCRQGFKYICEAKPCDSTNYCDEI